MHPKLWFYSAALTVCLMIVIRQTANKNRRWESEVAKPKVEKIVDFEASFLSRVSKPFRSKGCEAIQDELTERFEKIANRSDSDSLFDSFCSETPSEGSLGLSFCGILVSKDHLSKAVFESFYHYIDDRGRILACDDEKIAALRISYRIRYKQNGVLKTKRGAVYSLE